MDQPIGTIMICTGRRGIVVAVERKAANNYECRAVGCRQRVGVSARTAQEAIDVSMKAVDDMTIGQLGWGIKSETLS